jgi:hypothetical protein
MPYNIIFPIGDWSCDGHNCYADFVVKSNKPVQEIREVQYANPWVGNFCQEYEEDTVAFSFANNFQNPKTALEYLKGLVEKYHLDTNAKTSDGKWRMDEHLVAEEMLDEEEDTDFFDWPENYSIRMTPESVLDLWVYALNSCDPKLKLKIVSEALSQYYIKYKGYPVKKIDGEINIWGYDEQSRHLKTPGYGVWKDYEGEFHHDCS